jgi:hypothetical protein
VNGRRRGGNEHPEEDEGADRSNRELHELHL